MATHQKSCGTCAYAKTQVQALADNSLGITFDISAGSNPDNWYKVCTNPNGLEHRATINRRINIHYYKGKACHSKENNMSRTSSTDYIEFQQGSVKARLQNTKISINMSANFEFTDTNIEQIQNDLTSVVAVVKLASEKIQTAKPKASEIGVEV